MSVASARSELAAFIIKMLDAGAAVDSNPPVVRIEHGISLVVWSSAPKYVTRLRTTPFGSIADYRRLLEERQYNLVLADGSLIHVFLAFRHDNLVKQSICYYPCPVPLPETVSGSPDLAEAVDARLFQALDSCEWLPSSAEKEEASDSPSEEDLANRFALRMRAPLRFDFDLEAAAPLHPASHLHLADSYCRIPVSAPLSLGAFIHFLFSLFYPALWASQAFLQRWPVPPAQRCITPEQQAGIFIDWRA